MAYIQPSQIRDYLNVSSEVEDALLEALIERARQGQPLPDRWCTDEMEAQLQKRLADHGTREWRKAYPWMVGNELRCE